MTSPTVDGNITVVPFLGVKMMRVYMPLPFDAGVVGSAQGPDAAELWVPDSSDVDGDGDTTELVQVNSHFERGSLNGMIRWAWDFSDRYSDGTPVPIEVVALTAGTVVEYNDSYPNSGNPVNDHGFGNYVTIAYEITPSFTLYQTFAHLRQGSVSEAGIGLDPLFPVSAGQVVGVSSGSGGYPPHVHVHFGTTLSPSAYQYGA